jgi:SAM-dependent methyltransferase
VTESAQPYDAEFFRWQSDGSRRSADAIVPIVASLLKPRSVIDVGCGIGTWAAAFSEAGVEDVTGIDGDYVDQTQLQIPRDQFQTADLTRPLRLERRFDLAVSLEVAEHLPPERGESFVGDLVALAPAVLFSAAVPGQGGTNHLNERWQDEWEEMFAAHDYRAVDVVRPAVWANPAVEPWYSQNTLLYLAPEVSIQERPGITDAAHASIQEPRGIPIRVVHPRTLEIVVAFAAARNPPASQDVAPGGRSR